MTLAADGLALERGGRWLVRDIGFSLPAGAGLLVQGSNGCGKSTLLRTLCGLRRPVEGTVQWGGRPLPAALGELRSSLAYLSHADATRPDLSVEENLRSIVAISEEAVPEPRIESALQAVGLARHRHLRGRALSHGMRRRVALARFWATRRPLWILDEPLAGLDPASTTAVVERLRAHLKDGGIAVLSCHTDTWTRTDLPLQHLRWS